MTSVDTYDGGSRVVGRIDRLVAGTPKTSSRLIRSHRHARRTRTKTDGDPFTPFDAANYLNTAEDVAAYLDAVVDEADDDPTAIARALGSMARSRNFSQIARQVGMSRQGLYKALSVDGNPSLATVVQVSHALGLRLHLEALA